jgi:hypothetical protein
MSASPSPRTGWRGARIRSSIGSARRASVCTAETTSSSPECVAAASQIGRPAKALASATRSASSCGRGAAPSFSEPETVTSGAPSAVSCSAASLSCASTRSNRPSSPGAIRPIHRQRP